jgi:alanyl-tRNA synthetase
MKRPITSREIRQAFLDYFVERGHTVVPSASLIPYDDPTLLFTNAGMNQFKDVFLGTGTRPYSRATDTQKCMRVAGKHNDLEDVGRDGTHHTLFEMLGNWSFGDYYKKEAISWAWDLLTRVFGLAPDRLWATIFEDDEGVLLRDDEADVYWRTETGINPEHILPFGRKDNFWMMADTGPCGPNSEINYDRGIEACDKQDSNPSQPSMLIRAWGLRGWSLSCKTKTPITGQTFSGPSSALSRLWWGTLAKSVRKTSLLTGSLLTISGLSHA